MALDECEAVADADIVRTWLPLGLDDGASEAVPVPLAEATGLDELEPDRVPVIDEVHEDVSS